MAHPRNASAAGRNGRWTCAISVKLPLRLHRDERGTLSILSVFALLVLTMLLGMVMNAGRQVDNKIRQQNAADAAAYSGGDCLARGLNAIAFTNQMLCEVLALTAFFEEAEAHEAQDIVPSILNAWQSIAPIFQRAAFAKFKRLGMAIPQEAALEQQAVTAYGNWAQAAAGPLGGLCQWILNTEAIPQYQRAVAQFWPDVAQNTVMDVANHNGLPTTGPQGVMQGVLWRSSGVPVGGGYEAADPSLPVVDPTVETSYQQQAKLERDSLANAYLTLWNNKRLLFFKTNAQMSQFYSLWQSFSCGYLQKLLNDTYANSNLIFMIRNDGSGNINNTVLDRNYSYVGVVYWKKLPEMFPGLFRNPADSDAVAYAEVHLFVPRRRLVWHSLVANQSGNVASWVVGRQGQGGLQVPYLPGHIAARDDWDLLNQNWTAQLAPATQTQLPQILQTQPVTQGFAGTVQLPNLGAADINDLENISVH